MEENNRAKLVKSHKFSLVWLVPALAFIVTAILIISYSFDNSTYITLISEDASGIEAEKTLVKYRAVTVGNIKTIALTDDKKFVKMTVRILPDEEDLLRSDTKFYLVKPRVQLSNITGLDTLFTGNYIQLVAGNSKEYRDSFELEDKVPATVKDPNALILTLTSSQGRRIVEGDPVTYRGFVVGTINSSELNPDTGLISYKASIESKYRSLVNDESVFWINSGLDFSFGMSGISFRTENLQNLLSGGITFDNFNDHGKPIVNDSVIPLYENYTAAASGILVDRPHFVIMLDTRIGALKSGSVVKLKGIEIGRVTDSPWFDDPVSVIRNNSIIPVRFALSVKGVADETLVRNAKRALSDGKLCASVISSSVLAANDVISLSLSDKKGKCNTGVRLYRGDLVIPVIESRSISDQIAALTEHFAKLDFEGISNEVKQNLQTLNGLMKELTVSSQKLNQSEVMAETSKTVAELRNTLEALNGNSKNVPDNVISDIRELLSNMNQVLNEIRPAVDSVGQKPNSLIFGSDSDDPIPGGGEHK